MTDPKKDPTRRCMPVAQWPEKHRAAWEAALRPGDDLLDNPGPAAHWRPATRQKVASSYGRLLTFAMYQGCLDPSGSPEDLNVPELLRAYVLQLRQQIAPVTLGQRLTDLHEAFRVMAPNADLTFLRKAARRMAAQAHPTRDKASKIVHPRLILELALRLMAEAERLPGTATKRACHYRDGLLLALLAARPIRLGNLAAMRIGVHLLSEGCGYRLWFEGDEMKNHRLVDRNIPAVLTPHFDRYLSHHRPVLLDGREKDALWISYLGRPLYHHSIYEAVCEMTEAEFGFPINPHLIRDCHVTTIALVDPAHVRAAPAVLTHADPQTLEKAYNQADMVSALDQYQKDMLARRRELLEPRRKKARKG